MEAKTLYEAATEYATTSTQDIKDTGYGCGISFIVIKLNTKFGHWAKKQEGLVIRDGYHGAILNIPTPFTGTLEEEKYKWAFAQYLNRNNIKASVRTRLD